MQRYGFGHFFERLIGSHSKGEPSSELRLTRHPSGQYSPVVVFHYIYNV